MSKFSALLNLSLLACLSASALASPVSSITEISQSWRDNFNAGSAAAVAELYSDEAVIVPASNEIINGSGAISDYLNGLNYINVEDFVIWDLEVDADGKTAYETALWQATGVDAKGEPVAFDINVTNVMERQSDGSWKIKMQTWN